MLWSKIKQGSRDGQGSRGDLPLGRMIRISSKTVSLMTKHLSKDLRELRSETWVYLRDLCRQRSRSED